MKILVATNFFKGSLSAIEAAKCIKRGIHKTDDSIEVLTIPIADGGDGTIQAIKHCTDYEEIISDVKGPLGKNVKAKWLILTRDNEKVAIIEGAQANGLSILEPAEYNPLTTTTYGIGQLMLNALDRGCSKIYVTIGGSSTNDGGLGILQALGGSFTDSNGKELSSGGGPIENLANINLSNLDSRLQNTKLIVACDVDNPLCGPNGASAIYGPQKGATPELVKQLDKNLAHLADLVAQAKGEDLRNFPGVGAAGGIGFALKAILNADLMPGFDLVADLSDMEKKLNGVKLAITTEGRLDSQSLSGKAPYQVAQLAKKYGVPTIAIAGSIEKNLDLKKADITSAFSIVDGPMPLEKAMKDGASLLENIAEQVIGVYLLSTVKVL